MKQYLLTLIATIIVSHAYSQITEIKSDSIIDPLQVELELSNLSKKINDGMAIAKVSGGVAPYTFKWSNRETSLTSEISKNLTEGSKYSLIIIDSKQDTATTSFIIIASSTDERINSMFVPLVDFISTFIMADVFAMLKLYDPIIRAPNGEPLLHPNGDARTMKIPFVVIWLVLGALYFTIKMKFINFRGFKLAIDFVRGKYDDPKHGGEVNHFQALATALSGTVGLGNIAGVAIAISVGGPGATFWMILAGFLGMSTKFVECTLGVKYRKIDKDGKVSGGPMYYMSKALKDRNMAGLGKIMAFIFAILVIGGSFGGGNMFQANQAFSQIASMIPELKQYGAFFGVFLAILVGAVIIGGIKSIAKVTEKIVPFMAVLYVLTALIIIAMHYDHIGRAFSLIFEGSFAPGAIKGGIIGVLIIGFQRAAFSNEAGVGSASIAHSAVKTDEPITEGLVSLLEPFIDTVVICTMTALVIIFTDLHTNPAGLDGVQLTSSAFASVFSWFPYLLVIAISLFAFSTMISWSYYGLNGFQYLFGGIIKNKKLVTYSYQIIFLGFIVVGCASSLGAVVDFSDMMILSMAFPNILTLIILAPEVKRDLDIFLQKIKLGEIKKIKK